MDRRVKESKVEVPVRPVHTMATEAASDLTSTLERFVDWGVRVPVDGRAREAINLLREVAKTGLFTPAQLGDDRGFRALQLGMDLRAVADSLPVERVALLRKDIEKCLSGKLRFDPDHLEPSQFQSQLVVRAAVARMGVTPFVPGKAEFGAGKEPDILVSNGLSTYGIEIKRPTKVTTVISNAKNASAQIAEPGLKGGVVLDITDCVVGLAPIEAEDTVLRLYEDVAGLFFQKDVGFVPGQSHMLIAGVMARPMWIVAGKGGDAMVAVHSTSAVGAFGTRAGTLDFRRATWLRETINEGLNRIGFTVSEEGV